MGGSKSKFVTLPMMVPETFEGFRVLSDMNLKRCLKVLKKELERHPTRFRKSMKITRYDDKITFKNYKDDINAALLIRELCKAFQVDWNGDFSSTKLDQENAAMLCHEFRDILVQRPKFVIFKLVHSSEFELIGPTVSFCQ